MDNAPIGSISHNTTSQLWHPSTWSSKAQRITILAIAAILAVAAGIAGSLIGIGLACGVALGAFVLSLISLNCARKCCCIKSQQVAEKTLSPPLDSPSLTTGISSTTGTQNPLSHPQPPMTPLQLSLAQLTKAIDTAIWEPASDDTNVGVLTSSGSNQLTTTNTSPSMYSKLCSANNSIFFDLVDCLANINTVEDFNSYLVPLFQQYKKQPQKFVMLAGLFAVHTTRAGEKHWHLQGAKECLVKLEWPSENLKIKELPYILRSGLGETVHAGENTVVIKDHSNKTIAKHETFGIALRSRLLFGVGDFKGKTSLMSSELVQAIGLSFQEAARGLITLWQNGQCLDTFGMSIQISQSLETGFTHDMIAPLLPEIAKLPGILRSIEWWDVGVGVPNVNQPFQIEGNDGFCDADIDNLLAIARKHPYLQCVWNGSKMSKEGFDKFSTELAKILADHTALPNSAQLLAIAME